MESLADDEYFALCVGDEQCPYDASLSFPIPYAGYGLQLYFYSKMGRTGLKAKRVMVVVRFYLAMLVLRVLTRYSGSWGWQVTPRNQFCSPVTLFDSYTDYGFPQYICTFIHGEVNNGVRM